MAMSDFDVSADARDIIDGLLDFVVKYIQPIEKQHAELLDSERNRYTPDGFFVPEVVELRRQVRMESAKAGFYTIFGDERIGGGGVDTVDLVHVQEALNHFVGPDRPLIRDNVIPSVFTNGLSPILLQLPEQTRDRYIDAIGSGESTMCFALSEPDAGSDAFNIKTRATRVDGGWQITGVKQWITNAPYADFAMVFAVTDPEVAARRRGGVSCFFVPTASEGFSVDSVIPLVGHIGSETAIVSLNDVFVPDDHAIGEVDQGLRLALGGINRGRLSMSSSCVGLARWAMEKAVDYSKQRKAFGKTINEHQLIQLKLAEMAMDIYAVKSVVLRTATLVQAGRPAIKETSITKAMATEMCGRVMDSAMQVHGGMGLTNELRIEAGWRLARMLRIPDGTSEIQRRTIARQLLDGDLAL
jgi:acyl-CoA dehydrogenase